MEGISVAKFRGKGFVLASLVAGAAAYFSKKENRDSALEMVNQAKEKLNSNSNVQNLKDTVNDAVSKVKKETENVEENLQDVASAAGHADEDIISANQMLDEGGGQQAIDEYNSSQDK